RGGGGDAGGGGADRGAAAGAGGVRGGGGHVPARPGRAARGEPAGRAGGVSVSGFGGGLILPELVSGRWQATKSADGGVEVWAPYPSTMLRMVPLPETSSGRIYTTRRTQMTAQKGSAFLL